MRVEDLLVMAILFVAITAMGHRLSGGISDRRGFFEASGSLPWWAVSASIVATLVSSVTFISVPASVFSEGGDLTYLQVVIGLAIGKLLIAAMVARPYYDSQGINSCYEYIGARLDRTTGEFSMLLGLLLNVLSSAAKLLTALIVLDVITGWGAFYCGAAIMAVSALWSTLGGLKTVIWTDFLLFVVFSSGALVTVAVLWFAIDMPVAEALVLLDTKAKLVFVDLTLDPTRRYAFFTVLLGTLGLSIAVSATQGTWQRVRACRSLKDVRRAYSLAAAFYALHLVILVIGLGLTVFYHQQPLPADVAAEIAAQPDRIFPYFILNELPVGLSGLFIAAIFAAAISTMDSLLTESADLSIRHLYQRFVPGASERHYLLASRVVLVLWSGVFLGLALAVNSLSADSLLDLTFKLPNYLYGAIFATIVLARLGIGRFPSFVAGFVVACCIVALLANFGIAYFLWCPLSGAAMVATVMLLSSQPELDDGVVRGEAGAV